MPSARLKSWRSPRRMAERCRSSTATASTGTRLAEPSGGPLSALDVQLTHHARIFVGLPANMRREIRATDRVGIERLLVEPGLDLRCLQSRAEPVDELRYRFLRRLRRRHHPEPHLGVEILVA